jgi:hypothetical protein
VSGETGEESLDTRMGEVDTWPGGHFPSHFGAIDQHARPEKIFQIRLSGANLPEERRVKDFKEGPPFDVIRRKVAEDAGLNISLSIDMKIHLSSSHAAMSQSPIVPEIDK